MAAVRYLVRDGDRSIAFHSAVLELFEARR